MANLFFNIVIFIFSSHCLNLDKQRGQYIAVLRSEQLKENFGLVHIDSFIVSWSLSIFKSLNFVVLCIS